MQGKENCRLSFLRVEKGKKPGGYVKLRQGDDAEYGQRTGETKKLLPIYEKR